MQVDSHLTAGQKLAVELPSEKCWDPNCAKCGFQSVAEYAAHSGQHLDVSDDLVATAAAFRQIPARFLGGHRPVLAKHLTELLQSKASQTKSQNVRDAIAAIAEDNPELLTSTSGNLSPTPRIDALPPYASATRTPGASSSKEPTLILDATVTSTSRKKKSHPHMSTKRSPKSNKKTSGDSSLKPAGGGTQRKAKRVHFVDEMGKPYTYVDFDGSSDARTFVKETKRQSKRSTRGSYGRMSPLHGGGICHLPTAHYSRRQRNPAGVGRRHVSAAERLGLIQPRRASAAKSRKGAAKIMTQKVSRSRVPRLPSRASPKAVLSARASSKRKSLKRTSTTSQPTGARSTVLPSGARPTDKPSATLSLAEIAANLPSFNTESLPLPSAAALTDTRPDLVPNADDDVVDNNLEDDNQQHELGDDLGDTFEDVQGDDEQQDYYEDLGDAGRRGHDDHGDDGHGGDDHGDSGGDDHDDGYYSESFSEPRTEDEDTDDSDIEFCSTGPLPARHSLRRRERHNPRRRRSHRRRADDSIYRSMEMQAEATRAMCQGLAHRMGASNSSATAVRSTFSSDGWSSNPLSLASVWGNSESLLRVRDTSTYNFLTRRFHLSASSARLKPKLSAILTQPLAPYIFTTDMAKRADVFGLALKYGVLHSGNMQSMLLNLARVNGLQLYARGLLFLLRKLQDSFEAMNAAFTMKETMYLSTMKTAFFANPADVALMCADLPLAGMLSAKEMKKGLAAADKAKVSGRRSFGGRGARGSGRSDRTRDFQRRDYQRRDYQRRDSQRDDRYRRTRGRGRGRR